MNQPDTQNDAKILLVDLDDTTLTTTRYLAQTRRAMMHRIAEDTARPESEVKAAMRNHYETYGPTDFLLVQGLKEQGFIDLDEEREARLTGRVRSAYHGARTNHLTAYPEMPELLQRAVKQGREVICLTDAEIMDTLVKFRAHYTKTLSNLDHFSWLVAFDDGSFKGYTEEDWQQFNEITDTVEFPFFTTDQRKPNTAINSLLQLKPHLFSPTEADELIQRHVRVLGNNRRTDIALAERLSCPGDYATWCRADVRKYGPKFAEFVSESAARLYSPENDALGSDVDTSLIQEVNHPRQLYERWNLTR